jgi:hypothetical protein
MENFDRATPPSLYYSATGYPPPRCALVYYSRTNFGSADTKPWGKGLSGLWPELKWAGFGQTGLLKTGLPQTGLTRFG